MVGQLLSQKSIKDWNIGVDLNAVKMQTTILNKPEMITPKQIIHCDDNALRKNSFLRPCNLLKERWIMVYEDEQRVFQVADNVFNTLIKASG